MTSQANSGSNSGIIVAIILAIAGAIIALLGFFTMPIASCEGLDMTMSDFADDFKRVAFNACTEFGGETSPGAGVWVGAIGGVLFFGGGIWAIVQRSNRASSLREPASLPPPAHTERMSRPQAAAVPPSPLQTETNAAPALAPASHSTAGRNLAMSDPVPAVKPFTYTQPTIADRMRNARPASFGRRAGGFLIDAGLVFVLWFIFVAIQTSIMGENAGETAAGALLMFGSFPAIFFAYHWLLGATSATLGMRMLGMRIIRVDGESLTTDGTLKRAAVLTGGSLILYGPFSGLRHPEGRCWHDLASDTGVVAL